MRLLSTSLQYQEIEQPDNFKIGNRPKMESWNLQILKDAVSAEQGEEVGKIFKQTIESVVGRQRICLFHRDSFSTEYSKLLQEKSTKEEILKAVLNDSDDMPYKRQYMHSACSAHALGYMQSAHAMVDTIAHVIYYALAMECDEATRLDATKINIYNVKRNLSCNESCVELLNSLNSWMEIDQYQYLVDFTNLSKHRSLVDTILSGDISPGSDRAHGLKFSSFEKDGRVYGEVYIDDWLNRFHREFVPPIILIGNKLNEVVNSRAS